MSKNFKTLTAHWNVLCPDGLANVFAPMARESWNTMYIVTDLKTMIRLHLSLEVNTRICVKLSVYNQVYFLQITMPVEL